MRRCRWSWFPSSPDCRDFAPWAIVGISADGRGARLLVPPAGRQGRCALRLVDVLKLVEYPRFRMELIRAIRDRCGLSQRALARRAGLSFRGVQLLESPEHDARVSSLERVVQAFGLPRSGVRRAVAGVLLEPPGSLFCASLRILEDGEATWRHHLMDSVDAVRRSRSAAELETPPARDLPERLRVLMAGVAETLAGECGFGAPQWTGGRRATRPSCVRRPVRSSSPQGVGASSEQPGAVPVAQRVRPRQLP